MGECLRLQMMRTNEDEQQIKYPIIVIIPMGACLRFSGQDKQSEFILECSNAWVQQTLED